MRQGVSLEAPEKEDSGQWGVLQGGRSEGGEEPDHVRLSEWRVLGQSCDNLTAVPSI